MFNISLIIIIIIDRMPSPVRSQLRDMETPSWFDSSAEDDVDTFGSGHPSDFSPQEKLRSHSSPFDLVENDLQLTDDDESDSSNKNSWSRDYYNSSPHLTASSLSSDSLKGTPIPSSSLKAIPVQSLNFSEDVSRSSSSLKAIAVQSLNSLKDEPIPSSSLEATSSLSSNSLKGMSKPSSFLRATSIQSSSKDAPLPASPLNSTLVQSLHSSKETPISSSPSKSISLSSSNSSKGVLNPSSSLEVTLPPSTTLHPEGGTTVSSTRHSVLSDSHNSIAVNDYEQGFLDDLLDKQDSFLKLKSSQNLDEELISSASTSRKRRKTIPVLRNNLPWSNSLSTDWGDFKVNS